MTSTLSGAPIEVHPCFATSTNDTNRSCHLSLSDYNIVGIKEIVLWNTFPVCLLYLTYWLSRHFIPKVNVCATRRRMSDHPSLLKKWLFCLPHEASHHQLASICPQDYTLIACKTFITVTALEICH